MSLFPFLCFSVLFCALVMVVVGREGKGGKVVPAILIVVEVLLLLQHEGILDVPFLSARDARNIGCGLVTVAATVDLMRQAEKTFPLLAMFAGLQQFLVALGVIDGVAL